MALQQTCSSTNLRIRPENQATLTFDAAGFVVTSRSCRYAVSGAGEGADKSIASLTGLFLRSQQEAGNYYEQFGYPLHVCSVLSSVHGHWVHGGLRLGENGVA